MANPKIRDPEFITPEMDYSAIASLLAQKEVDTQKRNEQKDSEFSGQLKYRALGDTVVNPIIEPGAVQNVDRQIVGFDIKVATADPFRDSDVDLKRVSSRGVVDRDTIEKRDIYFLQNYELFHSLYFSNREEDAQVLSSFLLRVSHKEAQRPKIITQDAPFAFSFRQLDGFRDPFLILIEEKSQSQAQDAVEAVKNITAPEKPKPTPVESTVPPC